MPERYRIFIIAGEASGDIHGGRLMNALKLICPDIHFNGIGGDKMKEEGLDSLFSIEQMAVMGFTEVIRHLPFFLKVRKKVIEQIQAENSQHVILIDYPGFNLNIAKKIKQTTNAQITYYICPQIWAWKENRLKIMKKYIDHAIVIFPFEQKWYADRGFDVFFTGHPLLDDYSKLNRKLYLESHGLTADKPTLTLYPGSRKQEFKVHFPTLIQAVHLLRTELPDLQIILGYAKTLEKHELKQISAPEWMSIEFEQPQHSLEAADAAVIVSGTSTLEAAVYETPAVVVYKMSNISWLVSKQLVKVPFAAMANLIAEEEVMPELLQHDVTPVNIAKKVLPLLKDIQHRKSVKIKLKEIRSRLGKKGAAERAAKYIMDKTG